MSQESLKRFVIKKKKLAKGAFGKVYKAERDGQRVALKFQNLDDAEDNFELERCLTEWLSEEGIGPRFVDQFVIKEARLGVIATELWHGTLEDYMHKHKRSTVPQIVMDKLRQQVRKLHHLDHVHLDIHEGNVLLKLRGSEVVDATLTDFGHTTHVLGIEAKQLKLPIKLYGLKKTDDPKDIDWQLLQNLEHEWKA